MNRKIKRVAAIHDLSGFGRASLSVVTPILSTMEIQVCAIPTAVLSTHTEYDGYTFVDLTDSMPAYIEHWKKLNLKFDSIYSGFLGSVKQIEIITKFIEDFKDDDTLVVIDPVMADNGKLYDTMNKKMVESMKSFIKNADIITPNYTEASYLLGKEYNLEITQEEIKKWLKELSDMGPDIVVMTSVPEKDETKETAVVAYNKKDNKYWKVSCEYIPAFYPGTGDMFTSVLVGSLLDGDSLPIAIDRGVNFITAAIRQSYGYDYPQIEGVLLEKVLNHLKMPVMISSYELM